MSPRDFKKKRNTLIREAFEFLDPEYGSFDEPARALAFDVLFESAYLR